MYLRSENTWGQQTKLTASDGATSDLFGVSVAISGHSVLVGATVQLIRSRPGSAYVFVRNGSTWIQQAKLTASDGAAGDSFGSVAISGETAVVGAHGDDDKGDFTSSAYVFVRSGTTWSQQTKLAANDGALSDLFGASVAISGVTVLVGADNQDANGTNSGAAYVFTTNFLITPNADLDITKSDDPDPVVAGTNLTYALTVTNNGPSDASGVTLTDTLPAGTTFVSASPAEANCTETTGVVTCNLVDLAAGQHAQVTIVATTEPNLADGAVITNQASVSAN